MNDKNIVLLEDSLSRVNFFKRYYPSLLHFEHVGPCVAYLKVLGSEVIDVLLLDHDLNGRTFEDSSNKNTGMEVVRYLCSHEYLQEFISKVIVHSLNPPAATNMARDLGDHGYNVIRIPYTILFYSIEHKGFRF